MPAMYYHYPPGYGGEPYNPYLPPPPIQRIPGEHGPDRRAFRRIVKGFVRNDQETWATLAHAAEQLNDPSLDNPHKETGRIPNALMNRQRQPYRKWRILGAGAVAAVAATGIAAVVVHESRQYEGPSNGERIARSASVLAQLHICEADMYAQLQYDRQALQNQPRDAAVKQRIKQDQLAVETARKADLPCVKDPTRALAQVPGPTDVPVFVSREVMTSFVVADWADQRMSFAEAQQNAESPAVAYDVQRQITAGDLAAEQYNR